MYLIRLLFAFALLLPVAVTLAMPLHKRAIPAMPAADPEPEAPPPSIPTTRPPVLWPGTEAWADSVLATMTLDQKLGQLLVTHAHGRPDHQTGSEWRRLVNVVENVGVGGVMFLGGDAAIQVDLTRALQERSRIPLLITQDQEFGAGMRVTGGSTFPQMMALGATRSPELAYRMGQAVADEARLMGVHQNYAPVADVNSNAANPIINVRAFGEMPHLVSDLAASYARGMQDGGILATAKHFPGHGDTEVDSHVSLPRLEHGRSRLDSLDLAPFRRQVEEGIMSIMVGHLSVPALDPSGTLATFSHPILTGLLRERWGFQGLIVTDGLNMGGVLNTHGPPEAAVLAIEAGADQLLLTRDEETVVRALRGAIEAGRISEARIDASVRRILRAKKWAGLGSRSAETLANYNAPGPGLLRSNRIIADEIARRSLTLVRNEGNLLPLAPTSRRVLALILDDGDNAATGEAWLAALQAQIPAETITHRRISSTTPRQVYEWAVQAAGEHDLVLIPAFVRVRSHSGTVALPESFGSLLNRVIGRGTPVVFTAMGSPYLTQQLSEQPAAVLHAFGGSESSQRAAVEALFGYIPIEGRMPVSVPGLTGYNAGIALPQARLRQSRPEEAGLNPALTMRVDDLITNAIRDRVFPGAAVAIGRNGVLTHLRGYGRHTYDMNAPVVQPGTAFDLASLTKVLATTIAVMRLHDERRIDLDAPVHRYLPEFAQNGKEGVTVRHLLTHSAGFRAFHPFHREGLTRPEDVRRFIFADRTRYTPGSQFVYSDFDMIVLGFIIEAITQMPLDRYLAEAVYNPMGLSRTGFRGVGRSDPLAVPTEVDRAWRGRLVQGEVHDEAASVLGGVAGHAGLFSTAEELAQLAFMLTNGGHASGQRLIRSETIDLFTRRVTRAGQYPSALGWLSNRPASEGYSSAGTRMSSRAFGHTGFTGTSIWIDPEEGIFVILLTNRVFPQRSNSRIGQIRADLGDLVMSSIEAPMRPLVAR